MRKKAAPLLLALWALVASCARRPSESFRGGLDAAKTDAARRDTLVVAVFSTSWCGWCKRLKSVTLSDPEVRTELRSFVFLELDAEKEGREAARRYGVRGYPQTLVLTPQGEVVGTIAGFVEPRPFLAELRRGRANGTASPSGR